MLELGSKSRRYHEELSRVINSSDMIKYSLKEKTIFTYKHLKKIKEEIFCKITKI